MTQARVLYRELIRYGKLHSEAEQILEQIRSAFRAAPKDESHAAQLLREGESKLGFLRMITPRPPKRSISEARTTYVYRDGKVHSGEANEISGASITYSEQERAQLKHKYRNMYSQYEKGTLNIPQPRGGGGCGSGGCGHVH
eukprot:CAMPEP_0184647874 /NCGR_PEP_ID=MMETSP0308-20130426/4897_1 /TAXON_ID=38269 /ORGANISM="Gloeochaete witrockiana, Strain SAG 46.84" /LENGTH=141 /DNA_ID=CAMNT_0027079245 /DNA_START=51 /DNA_END=476 /DNA_ORIENTATION=-